MADQLFQIDAFTTEAFHGNAAAVCLLDGPRDDTWQWALAQELYQSSLSFVLPAENGFSLRWFTRGGEVPINGTGTLCAAHALWEAGRASRSEPIHFQSKSGILTITLNDGWVEMDFPANPESSCEIPDHLIEGLGATPLYAGRNTRDLFVQLESGTAVRALQPNFEMLAKVEARGIVATGAGDSEGYDFVSRYFSPSTGMNEDPVNGSSHTCLGPFWQQRLGKSEMHGYQASTRGGVIRVRPNGDRVTIGGQAVTVAQGSVRG